jgi:ATP-binding cassette subfamily B protein
VIRDFLAWLQTAGGAAEPADWLTPVSITLGRTRFAVRGLRRQPRLAARLQTLLARRPGIKSASANPATGRLLVQHDPALSAAAIQALIAPVVQRLFADKPAPEPPDTALVLRLTQPHAAKFGRAVGGSVVVNLLGAARIVPIGLAMNAIAHGYRVRLPGLRLGQPGTVILMASLAVGGTALRGWLRQQSQITWTAASRDVQHDLRLLAWRRVQVVEAGFFDDDRRSTALTILGDDINQCERGLDATFALIDLSLNTLVLSSAILSYAPALGASSVLPIPALVLLSVVLHPRAQARYGLIAAEGAKLAAVLTDSLGGWATVRSFNAEAGEQDRIARTSDAYRATSQASLAAVVALPVLLETSVLVGQVSTYLLNSRLFAQGRTIGEFAIVNTAMGFLLFPLTTLGPTIENIGKGYAAFQRVRDFLETAPVEDEAGEAFPLAAVAGAIEYQNVGFSYAFGPPVFAGLSLNFPAGSWTGVVGLTGSGKSTLLKLLLRFYQPQAGRILIDGRDIAALRPADLRRAVALVSQDIYLFQRSVFDNIAIGRPGADLAAVTAAARLAQAHDFITRLPHGYDTILGERGHALSGGERQRIAIARAVLKDAPILVFDEAMSSLDSNTEMDVQAALRPVFAGRTVIAIAHRLATVRHADQIIVLEGGRLVGQGTHQELLQYPNRYRSLWDSQLGLDEQAPQPPL